MKPQELEPATGNGLNKNAPVFKMKEYSTPQKTDYEENGHYEMNQGGKRLFENLSEQKPFQRDINDISSNVVVKPYKK